MLRHEVHERRCISTSEPSMVDVLFNKISGGGLSSAADGH
jgi:hypothetical protein